MENPETVRQAISTLYCGHDAIAAGNASVWLGEFQKSLLAWQVCDKLLHERRDQVSCTFAAQTMRTKIQCSFHELPAESYQSLKDSLQQHLSNFCVNAEENSVILTQLCLALVDLYLQVPSWSGFINEIVSRFGSGAQEPLLLLNLLKVFPEEAYSTSQLRLGANRRKEIEAEFSKETPTIVLFLTRMVEAHKDNTAIVCKVFDCLGAWLLNTSLNSDDLAESPLLQLLLSVLADHTVDFKVHDRATDCLVQALYLCENIEKHPKLARTCFVGIHNMTQSFHMSVAQEDFDKLYNYCRLFTELAESLLQRIVDYPGQDLGDLSTLDLLMIAIGFHDYALAEMTFNVWYRLSEFLYIRDSSELNLVFKPYIARLIMALYKHSRFDSDHQGIPELNPEFSEFREKVSEVMKDIAFIVGSREIFTSMFELLKQQGQNSTWDETEAALFIMSSVAKNILPDEDVVVPSVVQAILALPQNTHIAIRHTAVQLIGQLREWIETNAEHLEKCLEFILGCVRQKELSKVAAESMESLCTTCYRKLVPYFDRLSEALIALDSMGVPEEAVIGLLRATSLTLSSLPHEEITVKLGVLCEKQAGGLQMMVENDKLNDENSALDPVILLDRLAAVFKQLVPSEQTNGKVWPWLPVIQQLWPLLSKILGKYQANIRVVEHCCRTMRYVIRSLGVQSFPLLEPLVSQMVDIYQRHQHSCFLYLGSILVDEYGSFAEVGPGLLQMLQSFMSPTFKLFEQPKGFLNHPDTVDDLFRLCIRFVQKAPFAFFPSECARPLFQCSLAALNLDHKDANQSVCKFIVECMDFVENVRKNKVSNQGAEAAEQIYSDFGAKLVESAILAAIFHLSHYFTRDIAEILFAMSSLDGEMLAVWLRDFLGIIPQRGASSATPEQLEDFYNRVNKASDLKSVTSALRDLTRLYR